jgi:hypothetical protein
MCKGVKDKVIGQWYIGRLRWVEDRGQYIGRRGSGMFEV